MRKLSLFLISLGFVYFLQIGSENEYGSEFALPYAASAEEASEEIKPIAEMVQGDLDAPIEMIEYASFTCPHCATFHADVYPKLKINYIDKGLVKFIYRDRALPGPSYSVQLASYIDRRRLRAARLACSLAWTLALGPV